MASPWARLWKNLVESFFLRKQKSLCSSKPVCHVRGVIFPAFPLNSVYFLTILIFLSFLFAWFCYLKASFDCYFTSPLFFFLFLYKKEPCSCDELSAYKISTRFCKHKRKEEVHHITFTICLLFFFLLLYPLSFGLFSCDRKANNTLPFLCNLPLYLYLVHLLPCSLSFFSKTKNIMDISIFLIVHSFCVISFLPPYRLRSICSH